jgi:energy-coupling factor transport system permease protein
MDPRTRIGLVVCVGLLAITMERPASLGLLAGLTLLPFVLPGGGGRRHLRTALLISAAIVWSTVISQGIFYREEPRLAWLHLGPLTIWREGVFYGLVQSLRVVAVGLAGVSLSTSTPPDRLHAALLRLRLPFGLALMATAALRFLPELAEAWTVVRRARARRGRPAHHRSPAAWLRLEVGLMRPLVARALRRSWTLAESLDSRGFDALAPRATRRPLAMAPWEPPALATAAILTLAIVAARLLYLLYASDSVHISVLRPLYGFVRAWL